ECYPRNICLVLKKRKKRKLEDQFIESQKSAIRKFFPSILVSSDNPNELGDSSNAQQKQGPLMLENASLYATFNEEIQNTDARDNEDFQHSSPAENTNVDEQETSPFSPAENTNEASLFSIFDPRTWDSLDNKKRDILVEKGHVREYNLKFPVDSINRHLLFLYKCNQLNIINFYLFATTLSHITSILYHTPSLQEYVFQSSDLCYTSLLAYCAPLPTKLLLQTGKAACVKHMCSASDGSMDWKDLGERLIHHEGRIEHVTNMNTWNELRLRKENWRQVLIIIVSTVKFLGKQNFSFRGTNEKVYQDYNGCGRRQWG
ncbi:hypothetical protein EJB05_02104, partial [Eragrostis curvula]